MVLLDCWKKRWLEMSERYLPKENAFVMAFTFVPALTLNASIAKGQEEGRAAIKGVARSYSQRECTVKHEWSVTHTTLSLTRCPKLKEKAYA